MKETNKWWRLPALLLVFFVALHAHGQTYVPVSNVGTVGSEPDTYDLTPFALLSGVHTYYFNDTNNGNPSDGLDCESSLTAAINCLNASAIDFNVGTNPGSYNWSGNGAGLIGNISGTSTAYTNPTMILYTSQGNSHIGSFVLSDIVGYTTFIRNDPNSYDVTGPSGDGNTTTHVIRINSPARLSTTTSPFPVVFDAYVSDQQSATSLYQLSFREQHTGQIINILGNLPSYVEDQPFSVSSSSVSLPNGTWNMTVTIGEPASGYTNYSTLGYGVTTAFGVGISQYNGEGIPYQGYTGSGFSSTTCAISFSGSFSLSDCLGYIFLPSANAFAPYGTMVGTFENVFPFSYVTSVVNTWDTLQASTTENVPTYGIRLHDVGIGSTTPLGNILPNFDALSTTTIEKYLSPTLLALFKSIASAAIWLTFFADVFFTVRNKIRT